jgi:hypothetical protein
MKPSLSLRLLALVAASTLSNATYAFFPFVTDDTGTQGQGGNQIELDYAFTKEYSDEVDEDGRFVDTTSGISNAFPMTYTYGVTDNVDVYIGLSRQTSPVNGWQNTEIGAKWVFAGDQSNGWSAAIKPAIILPVASGMQDDGLGNAETNWGLTLIGSYLADDYELHANAGYTSNRYAITANAEAQRTNLWGISIAPVLVLNDQWKVGVDLGFQTNPGYNSNYSSFWELGVQYAPIENLQLGLGFIASPALNASDNGWSYSITTGLAYQF